MAIDLKETLEYLPSEIATTATAILNLEEKKSPLDTKLAEIKTAVELEVGTNTALKNITARNGAIKDLLSQNNEYLQKSTEQAEIRTELGKLKIEYQRRRDLLNALIAIAGMK